MGYENAIIYKIVADELIYYGSTIEKTYQRIRHHRGQYKDFLLGKRNYQTSFDLIKLNNYKIELVENYPCKTKEELLLRERYWIENNVCVNKVIPTQTRKEWAEKNPDKVKKYYEDRKLRRYICECGANVCSSFKSAHLKTEKHLNAMASKVIE
jgi:hypothetical protein